MAARKKKTHERQEYVLGTHDDELDRLGLQHRLWRQQAVDLWRRAGLGRGQTVLDVGCGPGYATRELSRLVGPRGKIIAIDQSTRFLDHLSGQLAAHKIKNVAVQNADVEKLALAGSRADGAYVRWVLCFVRRPEAVIRGIARVLKRGGKLVVQDYFNYEGVVVAPKSRIAARFFSAVGNSWRARGGDPDIGCELPRLMRRAGFEIEEINSIVRVARPGSPLWNWPDSFFKNYVPVLVESGFLSRSEGEEFKREWRARSRDAAAFFTTPPIIEIIAVKK
jgi:ubiquinone/menaquinone biosynthesis C-methylase UbiE